MKTRTFTIIKPNAVADGNTGRIIDMWIMDGFSIRAMKMLYLSRNDAVKFYAVHKDKPFFHDLVEFMTSGPVVVAVLEKEDAVASLRRLVGNTDPMKADPGTIRQMFAADKTRNAIHASDSDENAYVEWSQFFSDSDIIDVEY